MYKPITTISYWFESSPRYKITTMATSTIPAEIYQDNTPMPFGMHKGKALGNIPAKYFLWLYDKGCDHAALKQYIISNMDCFQKEISRIPTRR